MAISFVGAGTVATGNPAILSVPTGYAAGDLLLIFTTTQGSPTTPTGWSSVTSASGNATIYSKIATSSEASVSLTTSTTVSASVMLAYRGVGYVDVVGNGSSGTSLTPTTNSLTTRFANDWVISFYSCNNVAATLTAPALTTQRSNQSPTGTTRGLLIADESQAIAGASIARIAALSTSVPWTAIAIALKEPQVFYIDPVNGADANNGQTFATALKNISGATAAKGIQAGDTVRIKEAPLYNTGVNATWTSVQQRGISPFNTQAVSGATTTAPIVVSTSLAHGYSTGDVIQISGITSGITSATGIWKVTVVISTSFSLNDSTANG